MADMISNIASFNTGCLLPFIQGFFTSNIGLFFVGVVTIAVVLRGLAALVHTKF